MILPRKMQRLATQKVRRTQRTGREDFLAVHLARNVPQFVDLLFGHLDVVLLGEVAREEQQLHDCTP